MLIERMKKVNKINDSEKANYQNKTHRKKLRSLIQNPKKALHFFF